jgi:ethanolamine utilization protein EutL
MAYLIAPPLEATYALDLALKAADVELKVWFPPPSETNFSGGYLVGSQSAVVAACNAFRDGVLEVAAKPLEV